MIINLQKGEKISLTKENSNLTKLLVGLGWDTNEYSGGFAFDLDASAFLLDQNGNASGIEDFIFYNNLEGGNGSVIHTGDNLTGEGEGDDEVIKIDLQKIPERIKKIAITVTIYEAVKRVQNFGQVANAYVRVINELTNEEFIHYDLGEDFSVETAVVVCEIYRHNDEWKFGAVGSGFSGGLQALCANYGLQAG
ncbi:putative stress response protein, TerZ- and CABP1 [Desulfosporosinus orientis DSM 765]|uniref:Putative stress response protein, TerZ-and CABP1 n=1 Tax=Desulfosporosinus orientis (strain ATCC 19365 / DSM 765 / NCIMB 8382 / VKM B-1628 / Singapore I) TaxID=768706 RepID=G7WCD1_DESOD|nr:TerD family protein [Desulfosporosinus orientis]AET66253.1 putative stress response protein, TerZ- and CABP1 [Desulfosporosinus orientis DSM 765]